MSPPQGPNVARIHTGNYNCQLFCCYDWILTAYADMIDTPSSTVPHSQERADEMSNDDRDHGMVPNKTTSNHGRSNTPRRSTPGFSDPV